MNKVLKVLSLAAFAVSLAFAQPQFGVRVGGGIVGLNGDDAKDLDMSFGVGGGAVAVIPAGPVQVAPELLFMYRQPGATSETEEGVKVDMNLAEFGLEIPVMVRIPFGALPLYAQVGPQIGFAFAAEMVGESCYGGTCVSADQDYDDRSTFEFGVAAGLGFKVMENLGIDARYYYGITGFDSRSEVKMSLYQVNFGVSYLF
jgi:opacity protein-like surface antigen